tara:strand:- start:497 stop:667 length:171 start_codon:yes stop_codon:yes gene_type:complete
MLLGWTKASAKNKVLMSHTEETQYKLSSVNGIEEKCSKQKRYVLNAQLKKPVLIMR